MRVEPPTAAGDDVEPDVLVVVVTYNSADVILDFLAALPRACEGLASVRVVVVDNGSSDATVAVVRRLAPWIDVLEPGTNLGYAGGINVALRNCTGRRATMILNPDAVPAAGAFKMLLAALEDASCGIAVPRVVDREGRLKYSLRREPTLLRALGESLLGGHRAARWPQLGDMVRDPSQYRDGARADWATGAALMLSRRVVDVVGLWDERYFLYSEETDYALRARDAGFHLRWVEAAVVAHPGGDMSRSPWLWSHVALNRVRLYRSRHGRTASAAYWIVVLLNEVSRAVCGRPTHRAAVGALLRGRVPPRPADA